MRGQGFNLTDQRRVFPQRRCMMGFGAGIDHQGTAAPPVTGKAGGTETVNVGGGIGAGEGRPDEVVNAGAGKIAVIDNDDQRKEIKRMLRGEGCAKILDPWVGKTAQPGGGWALHRQDAGEGKP